MIDIKNSSFNPWEELQKYQDNFSTTGKFGATAVFVGSMRDFNEGDEIKSMTLEYYSGMTENYLKKIIQQANLKWKLQDTMIIHRVGEINPSEPIVLVAVWSAHRANAFDASRYIMEELKSKAPFWKKEVLENGSRWVGKNTPG